MKKALIILHVILFCALVSDGHHIIGGEMIYQYLGQGASVNTSKYLITLKIFRDQNVPPNTAQMPSEVYIGIFNNDNGQQFQGPYPYYIVQKNSETPVKINPFPPCMSNSPNLSYHVGIYQFTVDLPDNEKGYTATYQTCCRVDDIENITNFNGSSTGSTFTCTIAPGKFKDSSPEFLTSIDVICAGKPFQLFYEATDADKDSLVYSLGAAFDGGSFRDDKNANPAPPPYNPVN